MAKFCTRCGSPMGENGKCAKCESKTQPKTQPKKKSENNNNTQKKQPDKKGKQDTKIDKILTLSIRITAAVLAVVVIATATVGALVYFDVMNIGFVNDMFVTTGMKDVVLSDPAKAPAETPVETTTVPPSATPQTTPDVSTPYQVTPIDADAYFQKYATVSATINVADSQTVRSESDVRDLFNNKGFNNISITTQYELDGTYVEEYEISTYSSKQHPMYQAIYESSAGIVWSFTEVNGTITANPISYNIDKDVPVIFSETGNITTYDSFTGKFYVCVPRSNLMTIKTFQSIDFSLIDTLTAEGIDNL